MTHHSEKDNVIEVNVLHCHPENHEIHASFSLLLDDEQIESPPGPGQFQKRIWLWTLRSLYIGIQPATAQEGQVSTTTTATTAKEKASLLSHRLDHCPDTDYQTHLSLIHDIILVTLQPQAPSPDLLPNFVFLPTITMPFISQTKHISQVIPCRTSYLSHRWRRRCPSIGHAT